MSSASTSAASASSTAGRYNSYGLSVSYWTTLCSDKWADIVNKREFDPSRCDNPLFQAVRAAVYSYLAIVKLHLGHPENLTQHLKEGRIFDHYWLEDDPVNQFKDTFAQLSPHLATTTALEEFEAAANTTSSSDAQDMTDYLGNNEFVHKVVAWLRIINGLVPGNQWGDHGPKFKFSLIEKVHDEKGKLLEQKELIPIRNPNWKERC